MSFGLYSIYDKVAKRYSLPIFFQTEPEAMRYYRDFCQKNPFARDTSFYKVGCFDLDNGSIFHEGSDFICDCIGDENGKV